ncbi:2-oxo acid dehydrogenase subunit E2 [Putridiphycobacter roseus]|uniref:Dihydrolipoamide acetyltransferase component of pyruvate dehydrogenase complex n=1 Tax=Putridiphycobacter roseus TaxID=2219161 RepID=A0A2W1N4M1_9FLAO|nr:dihydrolipoamide acetyltransferase family protein [Putridiphycobacter roseus]PZE18021.1 2-oxo acid dehydrogenase subunit E2 [Putridiphycobacter roseus]
MADIEIKLPKMGESVTEATITNWLKEVGDSVELDEPLVEVATDKVDNELPSEVEGTLTKIFFEKDEVAQVGDVIAIVSTTGGAAASPAPVKDTIASVPAPAESSRAKVTNDSNAATVVEKTGPSGKFYSPLVRSIAEKENISMAQLESIAGSGENGRVTKKDILSFIENGAPAVAATEKVKATTKQAPTKQVQLSTPNIPTMEGDEIIEMDRMRKLISDHMVMSMQVSPHVTSFVEADVTNIVMWRNKVKDNFLKKEGEKITFTPIFMEAVVKAIKDFPMVNVSVNGNQIIKRKDINIGMATALPSGNLIVPVIKKADNLNLIGLTKQVNGLANKARNNKLSSDDVSGGTYTVTNVGTFGNVMGTPIINQPQVAILALGAIRKVPAVIETPQGDTIGIRHKMFLSHSYDHRVVDGALGGMFVKRVAEYLEQFDLNREF